MELLLLLQSCCNLCTCGHCQEGVWSVLEMRLPSAHHDSAAVSTGRTNNTQSKSRNNTISVTLHLEPRPQLCSSCPISFLIQRNKQIPTTGAMHGRLGSQLKSDPRTSCSSVKVVCWSCYCLRCSRLCHH